MPSYIDVNKKENFYFFNDFNKSYIQKLNKIELKLEKVKK